jgi:hypothetical protein
MNEISVDPFASQILDESYLAVVGEGDPYYVALGRLSVQMAALRSRIPLKYYNIATDLLAGLSKVDVIKKRSTTYPTITKAMADGNVRDFIALQIKATRLRAGPGMDARSAMLWRIASDNEAEAPRTSIIAIDTLNKQDGVYGKDYGKEGGGVTVNIQNFTMEAPPSIAPREKPVNQPIEGEFTPITVET